jgi:hypothetical protein
MVKLFFLNIILNIIKKKKKKKFRLHKFNDL